MPDRARAFPPTRTFLAMSTLLMVSQFRKLPSHSDAPFDLSAFSPVSSNLAFWYVYHFSGSK